MYFLFRKPLPKSPKPFYSKNPITTIAVILTIIGMFVLGPIGVIYKSMAEELKTKADNNTVILMLQQMKENDARQWKEIERNRDKQQTDNSIIKSKTTIKYITKEILDFYMKLSPEEQRKFRNLYPSYQALPPPIE